MDKARHDGGYVLVYVVVVIVILCILVPAACSNSLQNLKAQQASVERMRQLYTAEGRIEQFVAEMLQQKPDGTVTENDKCKAEEAAQEKFSVQLRSVADQLSISFTSPENDKWDGNSCEVKAKVASINIVAKINANLTISTEPHYKMNDQSEEIFDYYYYKITDCTITYESYDISTATESEPEGGGDAE